MAPPERATTVRLVSLDALRGVAIVLMFLVTNQTPWAQLRHAPWIGCRIADLVYPLFLFLSGCSWGVSLESASPDPGAHLAKRRAWRCLRLFAIGCLLASFSAGTVKISLGTLQCIAIASLLGIPFARSSLRNVCAAGLAFTFAVAASECAYRSSTAARAGGKVPNAWSEGTTLTERIDTFVLGRPRGPEGVLPTISASAFLLFGIATGRILRRTKARTVGALPSESAPDPEIGHLGVLLGSGILLLLAGLGLGGEIPGIAPPLLPISGQLVTPSFVLAATGVLLALIVTAVLWCDILGFRRALRPLIIYGMNPLAAYVFVKLSQIWFFDFFRVPETGLTIRQWIVALSASWVEPGWTTPLLKVVVGFLFCWALWRRGRILKI